MEPPLKNETPADKKAAKRRNAEALLRDGVSVKEVSAQTGVHRSVLYRWCKEGGITPKKDYRRVGSGGGRKPSLDREMIAAALRTHTVEAVCERFACSVAHAYRIRADDDSRPRALLYRVDAAGVGSAKEVRALRKSAKDSGFDVVDVVEETKQGAARTRPGLRKVMQAARDGEVDIVVAWDVAQLGAVAHDVLDNLGELESLGVRVVAVAQGFDLWVGGEAMTLLRSLR